MDNKGIPIRTPRKGARLGNRQIVAGQPVLVVKAGKQEDFVTAEEIAEAIYGRPVDRIIFREADNGKKH
uniref:hypothetical protein n=1 Tax=Agathobacter sp. TaxID=2021311 RepID=UPI0040571441